MFEASTRGALTLLFTRHFYRIHTLSIESHDNIGWIRVLTPRGGTARPLNKLSLRMTFFPVVGIF